jgi:hypothetical protein
MVMLISLSMAHWRSVNLHSRAIAGTLWRVYMRMHASICSVLVNTAMLECVAPVTGTDGPDANLTRAHQQQEYVTTSSTQSIAGDLPMPMPPRPPPINARYMIATPQLPKQPLYRSAQQNMYVVLYAILK